MVVLPRWHCKVERGVRYSFSGLEILLGEGGDIELGARTSEHIIVFAFDPLVSTLSLLTFICPKHHSFHIIHIACVVPCIFHIVISLYAWLDCVCVSLVLNHKSFI